MENQAVLLRYHEIALKGDNRGWFEDRLAINARKLIQRSLGKSAKIDVLRQRGRIVIQTDWDNRTRVALQRLFGLSSFSTMRKVPTDRQKIREAALEEFKSVVKTKGLPKSFRVLTKRSDKALPEPSMEIDRFVGSAIKEEFPELKVELKKPEFVLGLEIRNETSYIWTEKIPGYGGLPVGTNGRVLALLSGGLDSPVAAIKALRRGSPVSYVHFYGAPFVGEDVLEKIQDLARIINRYQPDPQPIHVVPFGKIQEKIALSSNPKMRTVLYRRLMVRIASALAERIEAFALVTGESLGQVASQTVENLSTINAVATIPILRPLITYDKDEIIDEAKKWETYDISVRPGLDCCTLFSDRHPVIRASNSLLDEQERQFDISALVKEALEQIHILRV